jgi:hypothetical protein
METRPPFAFKELFTFLIGDMAKAVCGRSGEPQQQKATRAEAASHMILGFLPRDVIEGMLAGHCMMFHELMVDTVRHTLLGEMDTTRRATRSGIVEMDKCFARNLTRLEGYQRRPAEGQRDAQTAGTQAETEMVERTPRPVAPSGVASTSAVRDRAPAVETRVNPPVAEAPSQIMDDAQFAPEVIAACRANPAAMAAIDAGDAEAFALAMGIVMPGEADLAAAGGEAEGLDRQPPAVRQAVSAIPLPQAESAGVRALSPDIAVGLDAPAVTPGLVSGI